MVGVSAGMVLGVLVMSYIANLFSLEIAMMAFALVNLIALALTIIYVPSMPVKEKMSYGSQLKILKDINLTMEDGKIYSIIGPSGAGKTTLLQLLSGLQTVQSGECLFKGQTMEDVVVSLIPQDYGLLPWQTVRQAVTAGAKLSQKKKLTQAEQEDITTLLEQMNLLEH